MQFWDSLSPLSLDKGPWLLLFSVGMFPCLHGLEQDIVLFVLEKQRQRG